jgi:tetratricopeptide (TPR) repeat protein
MKSASNRFIGFVGSCCTALAVAGCATGSVPLFKKTETKEEALPDIHPMRKERATAAAKKFDTERNDAEFQAASAEWRQGNFKACRAGLDRILTRDKAHRESLVLLAELELEEDRPENAVEILRRGIAEHPEDAEMSFKLGLALESAGDQSEALHHFHVATQLAPQEKKYAEVYQHAEQYARETGAEPEAGARTEDLTNTKSEPTPTIQLTSNETALETESTEIESDDTSDDASPSEPTPIERAAAAWDAGRKAECEQAVGEILAREPKHIEANILQVEIDLDAGRHDEARDRIEHLAIRNPHDAQVRRACGLVYEALGDTARAASAFSAAEALELGAIEDTTPRSQLAKAEARAKAASPGTIQMVSSSTSTVELKPEREASQPADASSVDSAPVAASLPEAPAQNSPPSAPKVLAAETFTPALPILGPEAAEPVGGPKTRRSARQLVDKGEVFLKAGQYDDARRELSAAISSKSCEVKTASAAALAPLKYEQSELALALAREGLKKYPDSAGLHRIEGTAALRLGRHLEAEAALRHSLNLDNSQALTYFLLGSVYERLGNQEASARHLSQAARLDRRYAQRK